MRLVVSSVHTPCVHPTPRPPPQADAHIRRQPRVSGNYEQILGRSLEALVNRAEELKVKWQVRTAVAAAVCVRERVFRGVCSGRATVEVLGAGRQRPLQAGSRAGRLPRGHRTMLGLATFPTTAHHTRPAPHPNYDASICRTSM